MIDILTHWHIIFHLSAEIKLAIPFLLLSWKQKKCIKANKAKSKESEIYGNTCLRNVGSQFLREFQHLLDDSLHGFPLSSAAFLVTITPGRKKDDRKHKRKKLFGLFTSFPENIVTASVWILHSFYIYSALRYLSGHDRWLKRNWLSVFLLGFALRRNLKGQSIGEGSTWSISKCIS